MSSVVLVSVLGPPRLLCGTHDFTPPIMQEWFNTVPRQFPGYICNRIKFFAADTFLAISHSQDAAYVLITRDNGHNWSVAKTFPGAQLITLDVGAGYAWISTRDGVLRSSDGYNWPMVPGSPGGIRNFVIFPDGRIMAHAGAKLWKCPGLDQPWQEIHSPIRGGILPWWDTTVDPGSVSFAIAGNNTRIIASNGPTLYETTNFGDSWTKIYTWSTWYIPRELHYTRGSTFVLKLRTLHPGDPQINRIEVSSNNCRSFTYKFDQDVTWEHQIEYVKSMDLLLVGHTRYMEPKPWETWLARFVPAIMYSNGTGNSFTEVVSDTFGQTFSIIAISAGTTNPGAGKAPYRMDVLVKKPGVTGVEKPFNMDFRLVRISEVQYGIDTFLEKSVDKTYSMDSLMRKICNRPYSADVLLQDTFSKSYEIKGPSIAVRKTTTYNMDSMMKKRIRAIYGMDFLSKKKVSKRYGMDLIIVGNYIAPLKREVSILFPQPFDLSSEIVGYTLRDVLPEEVVQHGY